MSSLHRNVNPNHADDDFVVTMQAFSPQSKEDYKLSLDSEAVWSAKESFNYRTRILGRNSLGVWTLDIEEFLKLELQVVADPVLPPDPPNPSHSLVDFAHKDKAAKRDAARRLAAAANERAISRLIIKP